MCAPSPEKATVCMADADEPTFKQCRRHFWKPHMTLNDGMCPSYGGARELSSFEMRSNGNLQLSTNCAGLLQRTSREMDAAP